MTAILALTCDNETDRRGAGNASTVLTHLTDLSGRGLGVSLPSNEEWRPIPNWEDRYEVSDQGRVRSLKSGRVLKQHANGKGYLRVGLTRAPLSQTCTVHRLVLEAFVRFRREDEVCRHLNGNPADNRLENICWGSHYENSLDMLRHGTNVNAAKTHCSKGHSYAEHGGVYLKRSKSGHMHPTRYCYPCRRPRDNARVAAIRARIDAAQSVSEDVA